MDPSTICFRTPAGIVARQGNILVSLHAGAVSTEHFAKTDALLRDLRSDHPDGCAIVTLVTPGGLAFPLDRVRSDSFTEQNKDYVQAICIIVEQAGFGAAAIRTVATGMNLIARRNLAYVFASRHTAVSQALEAVEPNTVARCSRLPEIIHLLADLEVGLQRIAV